jgi:hypothetical protein
LLSLLQTRNDKSANGQSNPWADYSYSVLALNKIKEHGSTNEKHIEAQKIELDRTSQVQPDWPSTQAKVISKNQESIQILISTAIVLCQHDHPLNAFEAWCNLQEKNGVNFLPAEVSGVSYRNPCAALCFLQHTARVLHHELVGKLSHSPVLGKCFF